MRGAAIKRIWFLYAVIGIAASILVAKLFIVQVLHAEEYTEHADRQYVAPRVDDFERGSIYFAEKNGNWVSAATLDNGFTLAINPKQIEDPDTVYEALRHLIDLDYRVFMEHAALTDDPYEILKHRVEESVGADIAALNIPGVILSKEKWRYYPAGKLAAHTLGFVGYSEDGLSGRYGLERRYNDILLRDPDELYVNFFAEVFSNITRDLTARGRGNRQGDLVTTIEPTVQRELENTLNELANEWSTPIAGGIVIHPKTGEIEALAALPVYDPNTYSSEADQTVYSNPLVENVYEMGSIVKPLTVASGLDVGVITAESTYHDYGFLDISGETIQNYDGRGRGVVDMQEVLNQSLNTGVVHIMQQMGRETFRDYMEAFGLGQKTGIDLPNEVRGLASSLTVDQDIGYATASFGQGIAVTPINMTQMLSVLANGGIHITPHIVSDINYTLGFAESKEYEPGERVISTETSEEITRMLVEVVDDALQGGTVKMDRYSIAAKTGTAQIADPENGGYYEDKYLHSFFGYFPAYDPEFLIFLYIIDPKEVRYASETLTPPFIDLTKFLINYYEILPDR